ncbi:MAG: hypothetical protein COT81_02720 [Candidatus Buchananbacteria bacterium CG10_big_fil_rev_8_21_14_0_10_42_9]|uniref:Uncharacterized protein n=1 Tax=Candidatus Buchananbacteria bacterium CG10_big_fil_rev_8_21_14_0_10_42_9 TaxID=1974526 RepID=A0A2H0W194_9BACT|nr:MAG: hypothetical protein COT81_02720 [Candidatus Buchananbacteria bacterium CG10_big_fil_rev_8_21_14_0_10_42_9]
MSQNIGWAILRFILRDLIGQILYWPIWWFGPGLLKILTLAMGEINNAAESLSLRIWVKSLFKPMYAQFDLSGRLISFGVRLVVLILRVVILMIWTALILFLVLIWLIFPIAVLYLFWLNFINLFYVYVSF